MTHDIPTVYYWERITKLSDQLDISPIDVFAVFIYLNNGEFTWFANRKDSTQQYFDSGLYRADILQNARFRKTNRVIFPEEYSDVDPVQQSIQSIFETCGFSRIYCLSRFCSDCSLLLAANNHGAALSNAHEIYKQTVDDFEQFCCHFVDEMVDAIVEELPALDKTRFATDSRFRQMVIKNRSKEPVAHLSDGEREVLYWAGQGKTSEETGLLMGLTKSTLETYRKRAIAKLNASNITHAVYLAKLYHLIA